MHGSSSSNIPIADTPQALAFENFGTEKWTGWHNPWPM